ncbi:hypothetical protein [Ruminococcus sp. Marseille-P6503]|uniref:hypothetical protein n=1 Tax=Ruminococcus sp. Marseille-P6503 TaxID=2364796 RepID=UPI000F52C17F|nr:hypothetical protein [Ruminococcus sp. Marseille-P6503]
MTVKTVSKLSRALCAGIASAIVFSSLFPSGGLEAEKMSLLFPQFIIGVSAERRDDSDERVRVEDKEVKREYSFKIAELFHKLFG